MSLIFSFFFSPFPFDVTEGEDDLTQRIGRLEGLFRDSSLTAKVKALSNANFAKEVRTVALFELHIPNLWDTNAADWATEAAKQEVRDAETEAQLAFHNHLAPAIIPANSGRVLVDGTKKHLFGEEIIPDEYVLCKDGAHGLHVLFVIELKRGGKSLDDDGIGRCSFSFFFFFRLLSLTIECFWNRTSLDAGPEASHGSEEKDACLLCAHKPRCD